MVMCHSATFHRDFNQHFNLVVVRKHQANTHGSHGGPTAATSWVEGNDIPLRD
jgi:hypothetical protein